MYLSILNSKGIFPVYPLLFTMHLFSVFAHMIEQEQQQRKQTVSVQWTNRKTKLPANPVQ